MFKNILVPYDGSKPADKAANYAVGLAKAFATGNEKGCRITLLHVVPRIPTSPLFIERPMSTTLNHIPLSKYIENLYAEMQTHAAEMLKEKKKELELVLDSKATVEIIVSIADSVADEIVKLATAEKIDLIAIGNVGLSGISKLKTLGSVSRGVSERAPCPVMIVH